MQIIAHRGDLSQGPENSWAALKGLLIAVIVSSWMFN